MKNRFYCFCCGELEPKHQKGCDQYRQALLLIFGSDPKKIFAATDAGMIPPPPWVATADAGELETEAQEMRAAGLPWKQVAKKLAARGYKTKRGKNPTAANVAQAIKCAQKRGLPI